MGLFGAQVGVKLDEDDRARLTAEHGAGPFGPAERPMGGYVALPEAWRSSPSDAEPWIATSLAHVGRLAPKQKKEKAKK